MKRNGRPPRVRIRTSDNEEQVAVVKLASPNRCALMLQLERPVQVAAGIYFNFLALLSRDGGETYEDLVSGEPVQVEWITAEAPAATEFVQKEHEHGN